MSKNKWMVANLINDHRSQFEVQQSLVGWIDYGDSATKVSFGPPTAESAMSINEVVVDKFGYPHLTRHSVYVLDREQMAIVRAKGKLKCGNIEFRLLKA